MLENKKILFCGSSELSLGVLDYLKSQNISPQTIVTQPARPVGRKKVLTETMVYDWAEKENVNGKNIQVLKPEKLDADFLKDIRSQNFDLCLVASYGKILKQEFLDIFPKGVWNVHPSELPLYRGATPIPAQVIDGLKEIVVTIIKMDAGMDSGDILASEKMNFDWENKSVSTLEYQAGLLGGEVFFKHFDKFEQGLVMLQKQNHTNATFTKLLKKEDGDVSKEINDRDVEMIWRKHKAYLGWPGVFFIRENTRIKITEMQKDTVTSEIKILKLLPESKKEISLQDFENSYGKII